MRDRFRKCISILLLCVLLFNSGVVLLVHQYLVFRSDRFFDKQISHGLYKVNDLTEVKIPANLPGISDAGYTKVFGEVQFAEAAYNYVAMRITPTAIYLKCVPNYNTTRLCGQNIIHAENIPDIPVPKKQHVPFSKLSILGHFIFVFHNFNFAGATKTRSSLPATAEYRRLDCALDIPQPPPKPPVTRYI